MKNLHHLNKNKISLKRLKVWSRLKSHLLPLIHNVQRHGGQTISWNLFFWGKSVKLAFIEIKTNIPQYKYDMGTGKFSKSQLSHVMWSKYNIFFMVKFIGMDPIFVVSMKLDF